MERNEIKSVNIARVVPRGSWFDVGLDLVKPLLWLLRKDTSQFKEQR